MVNYNISNSFSREIDAITFFNSVPVPYVELKLFNCVGRYPSVLAERDGGGNQTYSKVFFISDAFPNIVEYHFPCVDESLRLALSQLNPCNITPDFGFARDEVRESRRDEFSTGFSSVVTAFEQDNNPTIKKEVNSKTTNPTLKPLLANITFLLFA